MIITSILAATAVAATTAAKAVIVGEALTAVGTVLIAAQPIADKIRDK